MCKSLFFEVDNNLGVKVVVSANFFNVPRGSWKLIPGSSKTRHKKTLKDIKKGDKVVYVGRKSPQKHLNQAHARAKELTLSRKYYVSRVIDFSDEEEYQNYIVEKVLARGW
ncbi:MAG: hypothetical protein PHP37_03110 [Patescibacteria group bacterium]|nr:hypothetical protein [Patescibacteria group bacterium]